MGEGGDRCPHPPRVLAEYSGGTDRRPASSKPGRRGKSPILQLVDGRKNRMRRRAAVLGACHSARSKNLTREPDAQGSASGCAPLVKFAIRHGLTSGLGSEASPSMRGHKQSATVRSTTNSNIDLRSYDAPGNCVHRQYQQQSSCRGVSCLPGAAATPRCRRPGRSPSERSFGGWPTEIPTTKWPRSSACRRGLLKLPPAR